MQASGQDGVTAQTTAWWWGAGEDTWRFLGLGDESGLGKCGDDRLGFPACGVKGSLTSFTEIRSPGRF